MQALLEPALRCGVTASEFWEQTPHETVLAIEAGIWRDQQAQRQQIAQAWLTAALTRAKKLPMLKQIVGSGPAKPLKGPELERQRQEYKEMVAAIDISKVDLSGIGKPKNKAVANESAT